MSGERAPISIEEVSRSMVLADSIRSSGLVGEKSGSQADIAEQKAQDLLKSKFLPSSYESVTQIKEVMDNPSSSEIQKVNARKALTDLGSALIIADPKLLDKIGQIDANVPPSFRGISEEVFKNWFVTGPDDEIGKSLVTSLSEVEAFNLKVKRAPNIYGSKRAQVVEGQVEVMMKMFDSVEEDSLDGLKIGTVVDYLDGMVEVSTKGVEGDVVDYTPPIVVDQPDSGDKESRDRVESRPWDLKPDAMADAMLDMDYSMNFQSRTPPGWLENLKPEQLGFANTKEEKDRLKGRIMLMAMVNDAASWLKGAGKDLDRIMGSKTAFSFTHEYMNTLFDDDFKLVMSKMINDLCEPYIDCNGNSCLRYKECFYEYDYNADGGKGDYVYDIVKIDGKEVKKRRILPDIPENRNRGVRTIDQNVFNNIDNREDYLNGLAKFLAKSRRGEEAKVTYLDRMNAYSAWNLWFAMGNSSVADRMRILPTWEGIMSDALRTLNPEYKALAKWQILKGGKLRKDENLFDAEYFSGPIADYVISVMRLERDIGHPIDGEKTLREKIVDGTVRIFPDKTFYGFFDFCNGSRDLNLPKGSSESLGKLIMDYAKFDSNGNLIKGTEKDFKFKSGQTTFMNEFRDSLEAATLAYKAVTGKTEAKTVTDLALMLKDKFGMANGIEFGDGTKPFSYTTSPDFWARAIQATLKPNQKWLSSDFIPIVKPETKDGTILDYDLYVSRLVRNRLNIDTMNVNVDKVIEMLGVVSYKDGLKKPETNSLFGLIKNQITNERRGVERTRKLKEEQAIKLRRIGKSDELKSLEQDFESIRNLSFDGDYKEMSMSLKRSLEMGNVDASRKLVTEMRNFLNRRN